MTDEHSSDDEARSVTVFSASVDGVQILRTRFTAHLVFQMSRPDGTAVPAVHLQLAPEFARELAQNLLAAMQAAEP